MYIVKKKEGYNMKQSLHGYYVNSHSCFLLQYHLVLVTKYRKPVIANELEDLLINCTKEYFIKQNCKILEVNCCNDHIHILFEAQPQISLSKFISNFKISTSRKIRSKFSLYLKQYYWKPYFWSSSYFICTVSEQSTKIVSQYIKNQKGK